MRRFVTADEFAVIEERQDLGVRTQGIVADLANSSGRLISYVLSDTSVGRDNHIVAATAWQLDNFLRNPVMPWAHDTSQPTIAKWVDIGPRGNQLIGTAEYADYDTYPFADTIFRLVKGRFLNAVSTSWIPLEWKFTTDRSRPGGCDFSKVDLLECSQVPVPALPTALAMARAQGIDTTPLLAWAERMLDGGALAVLPRKELEQLRRDAKAPVGNRRQRRAAKFRGNPNHDDEGKFSSGDGGGGSGADDLQAKLKVLDEEGILGAPEVWDSLTKEQQKAWSDSVDEANAEDDEEEDSEDEDAGEDAKGPEDFQEADQAKLADLENQLNGHVETIKTGAEQVGAKAKELEDLRKTVSSGNDKAAAKADKVLDKIGELYDEYGLDLDSNHADELFNQDLSNAVDMDDLKDSVKSIAKFKGKLGVLRSTEERDPMTRRTANQRPVPKLTKRSLYHVSWLASLLSDLGCIQGSTAFESEIFETDSAIPAQLLDALKSLGAVLVAMTSEEVSKLLAGRDEDDAAALTFDVVEMSATGAAVRSNAMRLMRRLDDVALLALSGAMRQHIQGRKVSFQVGDVVTPVTRAGRVISAENERCLRSAHDHMTQATEIVRGVVDQVGDDDADQDDDDNNNDDDKERALRKRRAAALKLKLAATA